MAPLTQPRGKSLLLVRFGQALLLVTAAMIFATWFLAYRNGIELSSTFFLIGVLMAVPTAWLIFTRQPTNPVGWFIAIFAFCFALGEFSHQYVVYGAFRNPGVLPAIRLMAIPVYFIWFPGLICVLVLLPLYFPNGQLASPAWRPVAWLSYFVIIAISIVAAILPRADEIPGYPNPLGLPALIAPPELLNLIFNGLLFSWIVLGIIAAVSLIVRYRRAGMIERQQLKWFVFAISAIIILVVGQRLVQLPQVPAIIWDVLFAASIAAIWIAIAIAILRYRLFDIDLIIRRTVTYSIVTALLIAVYFASVVILQQVLVPGSGTDQNPLVMVLSTLAIAALFVPLRNRIQQLIDRRFYRKKYDAQKVLQEFGETVRDETDLDKLTGKLVEVVNETMQPRSVTVWLRPDDQNRSL